MEFELLVPTSILLIVVVCALCYLLPVMRLRAARR
jgi:hypothetical protein